jgi:hypothetical protein
MKVLTEDQIINLAYSAFTRGILATDIDFNGEIINHDLEHEHTDLEYVHKVFNSQFWLRCGEWLKDLGYLTSK